MIWLLAAALFTGAPQLPSPPAPTTPNYSVDRWEVDDGLPQNSVISIAQTDDGYLWLGTWAGLVRFDGVRFTTIATELTNNHIRALAKGQDNSVWIATGGGGVAHWRDGQLKTFTHADGLVDDHTTRLLVDQAGRVWVGTTNGVSVIDGDAVKTPRVSGTWPSGSVQSLAHGGDGSVIIATSFGVCRATHTEIACPSSPPRVPSAISGLAVDARNRILVATQNHGLTEWTGSAYAPGPCDAPECRGTGNLATVAVLADGEVLVGQTTSAFSFSAQGAVRRFTGLPVSIVRVFLKDAEGSLWIGTDGAGLARVRPTRVISYGIEEGLPASVTASIVQDANGDVWVGSRCGPLAKLGTSGRFELAPAALRMECTIVALAARDGSMWTGSERQGVRHVKDGVVRTFGLANGLSSNSIRVVYEDRSGAIWVAPESNTLHRITGGRIESFGLGAGRGEVSAFAETADGRMYIGSNAHGLMVFDGSRFIPVGADGRLPSRLISALLVDSQGDLWIGTANHGLYRMRGDRFEHFGASEGLPDQVVALMLEDDDANLWVSTSRGISRLLRERIDAVASGSARSIEPIVLGKADGMRSIEGSGGGFDPSGLKARDGRLWFSTLAGIAVVDPRRMPLNTVPPPVAIEHAILDDTDRRLATGDSVEVPAGTRTIAFEYTAFSMLAPTQVRFRYRLANFDEAWHDAGTRRSAFYTNLPPGPYRFEVMAANNDGLWSAAPATFSLVVLPYWWQRGAVQFAGLIVLLVGTGFAGRTLALRRARKQVAELERQHELDRERARIARDLHDDIGQRLTHLTLLADAADTPNVREQLSDVARETAHTMDELVWSVNAKHDTVEGLATYTLRFIEEYARAAGLRCRFHLPKRLDGRLSSDARRQLFLAVKEAVNNIVKHAGAQEVMLRLSTED
ncbi:MAG TPA: two-component regulator propeller domain-containing protein, partial [Vicinamibacterales bacterium]|nr:two-component regulator propeller domain-containing protein [Vicinamibacterales bacterium]